MLAENTLTAIISASFLLFMGAVLALFGYRLWWIILPIWGFFLGLAVGGQGVQALFGDGFLSTALSWVVAFCVGVLFAVLSYLFWFIAVALVGGYFGYALVVGLFGLLGVELNALVWILGVAVGVVFAIFTLVWNLQRYIVVIGTSALGAAAVVGTFLVALGTDAAADFADHPVKIVLDAGAGWAVLFFALAAFAIVFQLATTRYYEIERYNRWVEYSAAPPPPSGA
jgi:hypothetical protein